ncbi:MAG: mannonate dehydratase [Chloroflexota bacterium]
MPDQMRVAIGLPGNATDDQLTFAKQLGCSGVVLATPARLPGGARWEYADLVRLREWVESHDLKIESIQNTPASFFDQVRLGLPGRDEQIENYQATIRNLGRAGIPILGYNWRPNPLYRTGAKPGRGGAQVTTFDLDLARDLPLSHGRAFSADELWANYEYFIRAVMPVAQEAGVRLALHPDDPPGPSIGGVARIFSSFEGFERASRIVESPSWSLLFCVGCWSEMGGEENVLRGIRHFGPRGQLGYVHFRDVQGTGDHFAECFIGEGNLGVTTVMRALRDVGYSGFLIDDHVPHLVEDTGWAPRGRAYSTGYLMGLLRAVSDLG